MDNNLDEQNALVVAIFPDKVKIVVKDLDVFKNIEETLKVGSYLKIEDNENASLIAIIENFQISLRETKDKEGNPKIERDHVIEAFPLGVLKDGKFERGGDSLAIPPKDVVPATIEEIRKIYQESVDKNEGFCFSKLSSNPSVNVPVNGNKFVIIQRKKFKKVLDRVFAQKSKMNEPFKCLYKSVSRAAFMDHYASLF